MTPDIALATLRLLAAKLEAQVAALRFADRYYTGTQPLSFLAPEIRAQVGNRLASLVINWPRVIVDSVQRRCYVEGFRLDRGGEADEDLRVLWQLNDLDEWSQMANTDSFVHGRAFLSVGVNENDPTAPQIMVETAHQMAVAYSPGTRRVRAAIKSWVDGDRAFATLYEPEGRWRYAAQAPSYGLANDWRLVDFEPHGLGVVPIVPLVNKPRVLSLDGESELADVMPLADAVNKLATDMLVASEFHAMPRRWATGIQIAGGAADRERLQAEAQAYWDAASKEKTWLAGSGVQFGQFSEASLDNFVGAIKLLTAQIAAIGGLPPDDLGLNTTNPASAEARRAAETTLVGRAEEKHRILGGGYERAMQMAVATRDQIPFADLPREFRLMETIWRDPRTPAIAQSMDAAVKGVQAGIFDEVQGQIEVGLSPVERAAIAARREESTSTAATADVTAKLNLADELMRTQGLSQQAAFAAVGLLQAANALGRTPITPITP